MSVSSWRKCDGGSSLVHCVRPRSGRGLQSIGRAEAGEENREYELEAESMSASPWAESNKLREQGVTLSWRAPSE